MGSEMCIRDRRGADAGPWAKICALPAFWVGIIYDKVSLDQAWQLCKNWSSSDRNKLSKGVAKHGLRASIANRKVIEIASDLLKISHEGLIRRNKSNAHKTKRNEGEILKPLFERLLESLESCLERSHC